MKSLLRWGMPVWALGIAILALCWSVPAEAALFQGDGKDYVVYVRGDLWIFAREANTSVTVTNIATGAQVTGSPFTLTNIGQMQRITLAAGSNSNNHYRVTATKAVTVATGYLNLTAAPSDAWATYVTSDNGTRLGKTFHGWTNSTVSVFCAKTGAVTPSGRITDVTDQGTANDDSVALTPNNAVLNTSSVIVWGFTNFDQDQIRVDTSTDCSVVVGHNIATRDDWSVTPPSVDPTDKGRSYGKKFYLFVHEQMAIVPTQDNTRVTIKDLTPANGDKSKPTFTLGLKQFYTPLNMASQTGVSLYNGYTNIHDNNVRYNNDIIEVTADKPVWVYAGPTINDVGEHSITAMPLPVGGGKQEAFCFVQNGGANDIQVLTANRQSVTITTMAGRANSSQTIGLLNWSGPLAGPNWWQSSSFNRELIRISSNEPVWVLCGDFDDRSWMSFLNSVPQNRPPEITVQGGTTQTVQATQLLQFTITGFDPDNDLLSWSISGAPTGSVVAGPADVRTFSWRPLITQVGTYTMTVRITDNGNPNLTTTQDIIINVTAGPNRPPAFSTIPPNVATEDQAYSYNANAVDPDGHPVTYSLRSGPTGATINPTTGVVSWTPGDADGGQTRSFTIRACDNQTPPLCVDQSWNVAVINVNDPPTITSTAPTAATEGQLYSYNPTATDPDPGDILNWKIKGPAPTGMLINPVNGQIRWTPSAAQGGQSFTLVLEVCDQLNACDTQTWIIKVTDVNSPPTITSTPPTTALERRLYTYTPTVNDPDVGDTHTWSATVKPATAVINPATGVITWTPLTSDVGQNFNFTIRVCDRGNLCATQSWVVRVLPSNSPPSITTTPPATATENQLYTYSPAVTDPDPLEQHSWKLTQGPPGATIDPTTGRLTWTPQPADANKTFTFTIEVCDRANACVKQTWAVKVTDVNNPPVITTNPTLTATQDQAYQYNANATDADPGDTLTWKLKNGPTGATINPSTGVVTWKPDSSQGGKTAAFEIEVCDNANPPACTTQRWNVVVTNVNDPPVFTSTPPSRAVENQSYTYAPQITDPDPVDTHTFRKVAGPPGLTVDPTTGAVSWTPTSADAKKTFTVEIEVCDSANACVKQTWTITVTDVNNPPVITSTAPKTATEDQPYTYKPTVTDPDPGDTHTWKKTQGPTNLKVDPTTGEVTWTPDDGDVTTGTHTVEIEVCDSANACVKQSWSVTVTNVNDPPKITSTAPTTANQGQAYAYNATAIDPDPNEVLTWSLTKGHGNAAIDPQTGALTWTPTAADAAAGTRDFEIKVCDDDGACDTQTFTVTVKETNQPPKITSTAPTTAYVGEDINYQATATDPNAKDKLTWTLKKGPASAKIDPNTGLLTWTPDPNDGGTTVDVEIEVCDDATPPACETQTMTVAVRQKCRVDLDCKGQEICVQDSRFRICLDPGCATQTPKCPAGDFCNDGKCGKDICPAANCKSLCHPVRGCIDTCAGVKCQTGERCIDGKCTPSPCVQMACQQGEICDTSDTQKPSCIKDPCGQGTCKHGRICDQGTCQDDPCLTGALQCPNGQRCFAGQCLDPKTCIIDIDCEGNKVCEKGLCVEPGCYPNVPQCTTQGERCLKTTCNKRPCDGKKCALDEFCREVDGKCLKVCPSCPAGEICIDGTCITDPCAAANCAADQACVAGKCVPNRCNTPNPCKYGRVCSDPLQTCQDDPCGFTQCPKASQLCVAGECIENPTPCKVDKDCPNTQLCVNQRCVDAKCPPCPNGELCVNGQCTKDACSGVTCPTGQYCYAGQCVDPCASITCPERCQFGKCVPDPCKGKQCPVGESCDNGTCVPECCAADSCKQDRICRACRCYPDLCKSITCPNGTTCDVSDGQCKGDQPCPKQTDAECPGDQVCIAGNCKPSDCYRDGCPTGKFCSNGACIDNPCTGKQCANGEYCRPTTGQCAPSCSTCPNGQKCDPTTGQCIADPCDGKQCVGGERCDDTGNCIADKCIESKNGLCKFQRNCSNETCSDRPCEGITCPNGHTCRSGVCFKDQAPSENPENPGESTNEEKTPESSDAGDQNNQEQGNTTDSTNQDQGTNTDTTKDDDFFSVSGGCGCQTISAPFTPLFLLLLLLILPILRKRQS